MIKYMIIYRESGKTTGIRVAYHDEIVDYKSSDSDMLDKMAEDFDLCFPEGSKVKFWSDDTRDFFTVTIISPTHYYYNYC